MLVDSALGANISVVNPGTDRVVGTVHVPSVCYRAPLPSSTVFDPSNGLLYRPCGSNLTAIYPSNGTFAATIVLPVPAPHNATACLGALPQVTAITPDFANHRLFVLVWTCNLSPPSPAPDLLTVEVVDDRAQSATSLVTLPTDYSFGQEVAFAEPMAYEAGHHLLYVSSNESLVTSPIGPVISEVNASTGAIFGGVVLAGPCEGPFLVDDPTRGEALTTCITGATNETAIWSVIGVPVGAHPTPVDLFNWTGPCGTIKLGNLSEPSCTLIIPTWLAYSPATPDDLQLLLNGNTTFGGQSMGLLWQVNLSRGALSASATVPGTISSGVLDPLGDLEFVLDPANARVWKVSTTSLVEQGVTPLSLFVIGAAADPATSSTVVTAVTPCGELFGSPCSPELLEIGNAGGEVNWTRYLPGGISGPVVYDPANGRIYVYTSCRATVSPVCIWENTSSPGAGSAILEYSGSGQLVGEVFNVPEFSAAYMEGALDPVTGGIVYAGIGSPRLGVEVFQFNVTTNASTVPSGLTSPRCPLQSGLAYDPSDSSFYLVAHPCAYGPDVFQLNATTLAREASFNATTSLTPEVTFDPYGNSLLLGESPIEVRNGSTGAFERTLPENESGLLAFDVNSQILYSLGTNLTEIDPQTLTVLGAEPSPRIVGPSLNPLEVSFFVDASSGKAELVGGGAVFTLSPPLPVGFYVTFRETGLGAGARWSVDVNGTVESTSTATVSFQRTAGVYAYNVSGPAGLLPEPGSGSVAVLGASVQVAVTFSTLGTEYAALNFTETGLPFGTNWSVDVDGYRGASTGTLVDLAVALGSHRFTVGAIAGYAPDPRTGDVTVAADGAQQPITFAPVTSVGGSTTSPSKLSGLSPTDAYALVGGVGALAAACLSGAVAIRRRRRRSGLDAPAVPEFPPPTG